MEKSRSRTRLGIGAGLLAIAVAAIALVQEPMPALSSGAMATVAVPAPIVDETAPDGVTSETAVFAGGCFWGVQGVYQHVDGVTRAESGYAGGAADTANYDTVSTGDTGHAESVRVTYDPTKVTFGQLLHIFFSVVHDPTELNRQGPDTGTQYRSAIFTQDDTQRRVADAYISQLDEAAVFPDPIVTVVSPSTEFFPAEQYHQDYLNSHPTYPYIARNDIPKVHNLELLFPALYREQPVLILADGS